MSKRTFGIYCIDLDHEDFANKNRDTEAITSSIINYANTKIQERGHSGVKQYVVETLNDKFLEEIKDTGFSYKLFHSKKVLPHPWNTVIKDIIEIEESVLNKRRVINHDYILFIYTIESLYCLTYDIAFKNIERYIDHSFSIEVAKRLIVPGSVDIASARSIVGNLLATVNYFRRSQRISPLQSFGKVYKLISAAIRDDVLKKPELEAIFGSSKKRKNCEAKSSFKIRQGLSITEITSIIKFLDTEKDRPLTTEEEENIGFLSTIRELKNSESEQKKQVKYQLITELYDKFQSNQDLDYDVCPRDHETYLNADKFLITQGRTELETFDDPPSANELFEVLRKDLNISKLEDFEALLRKTRIRGEYESESSKYTDENILEHLSGETTLDDKKYFVLDRKVFEVKEAFIETINKEVKELAKDSTLFPNNLPFIKKWNPGNKSNYSEKSYNNSYLENGYLMGDRFLTKENIELFDVLFYSDSDPKVYLCHFKQGFNASMRDLCSQVKNSKDFIDLDSKGSKAMIKDYFSQFCNVKSDSEKYDAAQEFLKIGETKFLNFFNRQIIYVLGVYSSANPPNFKKPETIKSSIAKLEINNIVNEVGSKNLQIIFL